MRVLVACEFMGTVRDAFRRRGHEAFSCDLLPDVDFSPFHMQTDVKSILTEAWQDTMGRWDLMIAHPPCTHLAASGRASFHRKRLEQLEALDFVRFLLKAPVPKIALENPIGVISTQIRKPDQIIQPWMFGHNEQKATCLWLKNLKPLEAINEWFCPEHTLHNIGQRKDRWKIRSRTFKGVAEAMAEQWGGINGFEINVEL